MSMRIEVQRAHLDASDDFQAVVDDGRALIVPTEVGRVLKAMKIRTAERFISALHTSPTAFARAMNWDMSDVKLARDSLIRQLRGHVDARILDFEPGAFTRGTGAFAPPAGSAAPYRRTAGESD